MPPRTKQANASPPDPVPELVDRFGLHLETYRSGKYNETQLRRDFLDPFWGALGWDVHNEQGFAEAYRDVIHEDSIRIGGFTKAPDYCFRIGGTRKFFLEAKNPSISIGEDNAPAYQLRRYAWSAKLPLSVLSNFAEFAVYDCRIRPGKDDPASTARLVYCTFRDYAEKWAQIASIFGRAAMLKGSFDKFVESARAKRGTATVDDAFLDEIESWRKDLAQNLALRNPRLTQRELNFAVQRIIDRIIFLRICEDRGIEEYGRLQALQNGTQVYPRLCELFHDADTRYNSGLFHFRPEKGRHESPDEFTLGLAVDDKTLREIVRNLYYPDSPYELGVLPADILGQVYERFLGRTIRLTAGHRAVVEDKPEVRKAGGVYYTPTYVVEYIVQNTVGLLLKGKKPAQVAKLRILDPACGSGSFLIGAYQYLLDWHREWYMSNSPMEWAKGRNPTLHQTTVGGWRLTISERKRILLNNIFGVDIDSQAVEVTKLSLLLKVLEGENELTLQILLRFAHQRALPDLGDNIKCGNSLVGPDYYEGQQMSLLDDEERLRINAFDWQTEFPAVTRGGGFDAVIGKPPYVVTGSDIHPRRVVDHLNRFAVAQYKTDLFHLFIQRGIDLLRTGGGLGLIVPNTWLTLQFTDKLRRYVLDASAVSELVLFEHRVFPDADVHTALLFLAKRQPKPNHTVRIKRPLSVSTAKELEETQVSEIPQESWRTSDGCRFETRLVGAAGSLAATLMASFPRLDSVARASLGCQAYNSTKHTPEQIANRVFHSVRRAGKDYLPELSGKDVSRYLITRTRGEWIKYGPWLHDYRTMDWLQGPRVLIREIAGKRPHQIHACYVEKTYCHYKTILNVNPSEATTVSMKYLTGLLDSRLISFLYPFVSNKMVAQSFPRLSVGDVKRLPVRVVRPGDNTDKVRHDCMVGFVDQMLALNRKLATARTPAEQTAVARQITATDALIDRLVYELYGLTEQEIEIIESAT